ncbi:hypothetical protein N2152v2_008733 [Parachlorella kessleri]
MAPCPNHRPKSRRSALVCVLSVAFFGLIIYTTSARAAPQLSPGPATKRLLSTAVSPGVGLYSSDSSGDTVGAHSTGVSSPGKSSSDGGGSSRGGSSTGSKDGGGSSSTAGRNSVGDSTGAGDSKGQRTSSSGAPTPAVASSVQASTEGGRTSSSSGGSSGGGSPVALGSQHGPAINGSAEGVTIYQTANQRCRGPAVNESVPNLLLVANWDSYRPTQPQQLTLVTQVTPDRLGMLESQCRSWPHALAAVAYLPRLAGTPPPGQPGLGNYSEAAVAAAQQQLTEFHARIGREPGACNLHLQLYTELCDADMLDRYPANSLRNKALQLVQTEAVLLLDVDFIVSSEFGAELSTPEGWQYVRRQLDAVPVVIIPSFVPKIEELRRWGGGRVQEERLEWGVALAKEAAAGGKAWVVQRMLTKKPGFAPFNWGTAARRNTRVGTWYSTNEYYTAHYEKHFEPDIIILREHVPWFDERFRGYGLNKAIEFLALSQWGATFSVHPRGYAVHVPHHWSKTQRSSMASNLVNKNFELFDHVLCCEMPGEKYYPVTAFADRCPDKPSEPGSQH